jgi:predicted DNA binding CopG/RHH family protein
MTNKRVIPKFASEAEEANWWFEHADDFADDIMVAIADGTLVRGKTAHRFGLVSNLIELKPKDADLAREQAAKQGVAYETYIQELVHQALTSKAS